MHALIEALGVFAGLLPAAGTVVLAALLLWAADWFLFRRPVTGFLEARVIRQILMLALSFTLLTSIVFTLPLDGNAREQLLRIIGLLITAVLAFASTSFVSNAMAGLMLRAVRNFLPGDFIRVGEHFGRVTERGLFHTEIQTEDRDLTTLPNLHLVSNPVKVVRSSGTIVTTELSLGYDVPRQRIEPLLVSAAESIGLEGAYVQVRELLDHCVVYRVAGFLRDVTQLLSASSRLRASILDGLHGDGIEIASPALVMHRAVPANEPIIPQEGGMLPAVEKAKSSAETLAFDKAEHAASRGKLQGELVNLDREIEVLEQQIKKGGAAATAGQSDIERLVTERARTAELLRQLDESESE